jgi:hypothetical protein
MALNLKRQTLGMAQLVVLSATLGITLPLVVLLIWPREIHDAYVDHFFGDTLQRNYGFRVGEIRLHGTEGEPIRWRVITEVTPGGWLDQAGVRPGDTPWDFHGGGIPLLYVWLRELDEDPVVSFPVINAYDYSAGHYKTRTITIRRRPRVGA